MPPIFANGDFGQNYEKMRALLERHTRTFKMDPHPLTSRPAYVVLETPNFEFCPTTPDERNPSTHHANYVWVDKSNSLSPSSGEVTIPDGVICCQLSLISCTILNPSWDPVDLVHFLLKERYVDVQLDSSFDNLRPSEQLTVRNIRVASTSTLTSSGAASGTTLARNPSIRQINRSMVSNTSSIGSFMTARSQMSFVNPVSSRDNSAFFSVGEYDSATMIESIREDETPNSELSAPLVEIYNDYYTTLREQDIIQPFDKELNWSGKGQHVTFTSHDTIPLFSISPLGASMSATVDKVICRRIALARKTMRCNREWTVADALREVYHLQNLRHFHIVQLVGTYLQGRNFSILMYPAADMHLGRFMEDTSDLHRFDPYKRRFFLASTVGCLTSAVAYIHQHTTRHMDIKPQNILVRETRPTSFGPEWRVYIADFGLSRSFASQDHSQTDGPASRTPRYCAPEVYNSEERGRSADIFSLGCVYLEILTTICCIDLHDFSTARRGEGDDESFHANLERVVEWADSRLKVPKIYVTVRPEIVVDLFTSMVNREPSSRPTAVQIHDRLKSIGSGTYYLNKECCHLPPEPYEAYHVGVIARDMSY